VLQPRVLASSTTAAEQCEASSAAIREASASIAASIAASLGPTLVVDASPAGPDSPPHAVTETSSPAKRKHRMTCLWPPVSTPVDVAFGEL
jgi:hypothetical protein